MKGLAENWRSVFRIGMGVYWLYFASQKWPPRGIDWMHSLMVDAGQKSPIPVLHDFLVQVVTPNWQVFAIAQGIGETVVGALLVIGLATRPAALIGALLALNVSLTVAFLEPDVGLRWVYYLAVLASLDVAVNGGGSLALERSRSVPAWLRA
jgi:uncharacterized membrane protein YphA (DoxX/SURF4 family)